MNVRGALTALVVVLALSGCTLLPAPRPTVTLGEDVPRPTQDGTPPPAGIVTLTPEQVQPEDDPTYSYTIVVL